MPTEKAKAFLENLAASAAPSSPEWDLPQDPLVSPSTPQRTGKIRKAFTTIVSDDDLTPTNKKTNVFKVDLYVIHCFKFESFTKEASILQG